MTDFTTAPFPACPVCEAPSPQWTGFRVIEVTIGGLRACARCDAGHLAVIELDGTGGFAPLVLAFPA